jgi:hypothetical protein
VRIKRTQETGTINATDGEVVYVLLDGTNGTNLFSEYVDEDVYIELVTAWSKATLLQGDGQEETKCVGVQQPHDVSSANDLKRLFFHEERRGDILQHGAIHLDDLFKSHTIGGQDPANGAISM